MPSASKRQPKWVEQASHDAMRHENPENQVCACCAPPKNRNPQQAAKHVISQITPAGFSKTYSGPEGSGEKRCELDVIDAPQDRQQISSA